MSKFTQDPLYEKRKEINLPITIEMVGPVIEQNGKIAVGLSGGLDSTTLLHYLAFCFGPENVYPLSFYYGQRHNIELFYAYEQVKAAGIPEDNYKRIDISFLGQIVSKASAMVSGGLDVPKAEDAEKEVQPATYVPFRNTIFSSLLASFAESNGCNYIALGVQHADNTGYWDCTTEFRDALQNLMNLNRKNRIQILTPFVSASKSDEIKLGLQLGIDYKKTWTSYSGPKRRSGRPWTIGDEIKDPEGPYSLYSDASGKDRKLAFEIIGEKDPIPYIEG